LMLSRSAPAGTDLREHAVPTLTALAQQTGLTAELGVLARTDVVVIERVESTASVRVVSWIGRRYGANSTALGKALLAFLPPTEVNALLRQTRLPRPTERTIATSAALARELEHVRELGYAVADEEDEPGVRSVAAPILDARHHPLAAIAISGTTWQVPSDRLPSIGAVVREAAAQVGSG